MAVTQTPLRLFPLSLLIPVFMLFGCGDDGAAGVDAAADVGGSDVARPDTGGEVDSGELPGTESFTVEWGPVTVPGGAEDTRCVTRRLGNAESIRVSKIENDLGPASHHMIVYRVNDTEEQVEPIPCDPFFDTLDPSRGSTLTVTQRAEETIQLPPGVAFTLEANQMIRLELHYLNRTADEQVLTASSTLTTIPDALFEHEADFLFIGNPDVDIPARSEVSLGPSFFPLPAQYADVNFFSITGHTHQWGTNVKIDVVGSADDEGTPVYDVPGWLWSEPETVYHEPTFQVPEGGGFRFTCEYNNMSDSNVGFGEGASDEMCFFWAYYYPSQGAKVCIHTDQFGGMDGCCPGHPACSFLFQ